VLSPETLAEIRELRYLDGLSCRVVGERFGLGERMVNRLAPGWPGKVPNDRVRALFERSPMSAGDVARAVGWHSTGGKGTTGCSGQRVLRTLGLADEWSHGRVIRRRLVDAETAMLLAEAMGFGRWEALPDDRHA
jgi:hypothetical protein